MLIGLSTDENDGNSHLAELVLAAAPVLTFRVDKYPGSDTGCAKRTVIRGTLAENPAG
jgi:hypothetical protein